jgi:hypothetical protein
LAARGRGVARASGGTGLGSQNLPQAHPTQGTVSKIDISR